MIKLKVNLILLLILFSTACNLNKYSDSVYRDTDITQIQQLDHTLNLNIEIPDYLPDNLKDKKDISSYLDDAYTSMYKTGNNLFDMLETYAEYNRKESKLKKSKGDFDAIKSYGSLLKTIGKGALKGVGSMPSSVNLLSLKSDYEDLKKIYNDKVVDSLYFTISNILIGGLIVEEKTISIEKSIKNKSSILTIDNISSDIVEELKLEDLYDSYKELHHETNKIIWILILNKIKGIKCENEIKYQVQDVVNFWNSDKQTIKNSSKLYADFINKLEAFKTKYKILKEQYNNPQSYYKDLSEKSQLNIEMIIKCYNNEIISDIENTNIFSTFQKSEKELRLRIKQKSDLYFSK